MNERNNQTQSPSGKKKSSQQIIVGIVGIIILAVVYWVSKQSFYTGEPFIVTVDGTQIVPGKTTVQELIDAGFAVGESEFEASAMKYVFSEYDVSAEMEKKSYLIGASLNKNDQVAYRLEITNTSTTSTPLNECIVTEISVYPDDAAAFTTTIGETAATEFTLENITKYYPDAEDQSSMVSVENKQYRLDFEKDEEGKIGYITSSCDKNKQ